MESRKFHVQRSNINYTSGGRVHIRTSNHSEDQGNARKCKRSGCLVWLTVSLGLICVLLLVFIIWQNISIRAERDRYKTTVQEFNHTINSSQNNYTDLRTEKDQLKKSLSSLNQKNQECENRVNALSAEKEQMQQKKLELERNNASFCNQLKTKDFNQGQFFMTNEDKSWSDSRQFCRACGADLVMIKTEEKQRLISSFVKELLWIGLSDTEREGTMKWVDNSPLNQGFWERNEPNDAGGNEDCTELNPSKSVLKNWNDIPCSAMRKSVCER